MTTQEAFKKRIRARMAKTGEKYSAARRALLTDPVTTNVTNSAWASQPPHSEQAIQAGTGRSWDQWVSAIDAGPGRNATHTEIAAWVNASTDISGWWAQGVTVGYERITGKRLPGQMSDGTFTTSRSRTLAIDTASLRALIEEDDSRATLLPEVTATRTSRPGVKTPRYTLTDTADGTKLGTVQFGFDSLKDKTRLTVAHSALPSQDAADAWKDYWKEWLDVLTTHVS